MTGKPDRELIENKPDGFVIMVPQNEEWAKLIESCFPDARKVIRYAIKNDTVFNRGKLMDLVSQIPQGYEIRTIDEVF